MTVHPHRSGKLPSRPATPRERIDQTAYELFSRHGIRAVGVDTICARSGVAKMTLYRHYPSKDDLALAFLRRREELWTRSWLQQEVERRAHKPAERLLAVFDVFDKWFRRSDFEGCSFIKVLLEHGDRGHPVRKAAEAHIETIRAFLTGLAADAGVRDADAFARRLQMVMMGSIVAAYAGDRDAAQRAKEVGLLLLVRAGIRTGKGIQA
ncbi:MAG TPA: TetR/AcrR family transcriptional regulator [Acidobacteriaceae bacterium]